MHMKIQEQHRLSQLHNMSPTIHIMHRRRAAREGRTSPRGRTGE